MDGTRKRCFFLLLPLFIREFSVNRHFLVAFSQYAYFSCSCETSSTVAPVWFQYEVCNLPSTLHSPHTMKHASEMTCVGQLDNLRFISAGAAAMVEGVYFKVWTFEYELQDCACLLSIEKRAVFPEGRRQKRSPFQDMQTPFTHALTQRASLNNLVWDVLGLCRETLKKTQRQRESRQTCVLV